MGSLRVAAALYGVVIGTIGLATIASTVGGSTAGGAVALGPVILLGVADPALLVVTSALACRSGPAGDTAARAAAVVLIGRIGRIAHVALIAGQPGVLVSGVIPAVATLALLWTSRSGRASAERPIRRGTSSVRAGQALLLGVAIAAVGWSVVQVATSPTGGSSPLGILVVGAGLSTAAVHVALAVLTRLTATSSLGVAGVLDLAAGGLALQGGVALEPLVLVAVGAALIVLAAAAWRGDRTERRSGHIA